MGAIGQARRVDSLTTRNRIYDFCDDHVPIILTRGISSSRAISESINGLMRSGPGAAMQSRSVVKNWLLDHPEVVSCDDDVWSLRRVTA
jgi:hypothetical protein